MHGAEQMNFYQQCCVHTIMATWSACNIPFSIHSARLPTICSVLTCVRLQEKLSYSRNFWNCVQLLHTHTHTHRSSPSLSFECYMLVSYFFLRVFSPSFIFIRNQSVLNFHFRHRITATGGGAAARVQWNNTHFKILTVSLFRLIYDGDSGENNSFSPVDISQFLDLISPAKIPNGSSDTIRFE